MKLNKKSLWAVTAAVVTVLAAALLTFLFLPHKLPARVFTVAPGSGISTVRRQLIGNGFLSNQWGFVIAASIQGLNKNLTPGIYHTADFASPWELAAILRAKPVQVRFTIKDGDNYGQIRNRILAADKIKVVWANLTEADIIRFLDSNGSYRNLEGLLAPETFVVYEGTADTVIYQQAYRLRRQQLDRIWQERDKNLPYKNAYELLIAASLIEKETGIAAERGLVAAVLVNRLNKGMRLQTDPAVIYGLGADYAGKLGKKELAAATPYNTYTRAGLPPTPIAMPSWASLTAAAHPAAVDYLYFVAKNDGTGTSVFSRTLSEHRRAVEQYILGK